MLGVATDLNHDSLLYASGFRLMGTSVGNLLAPSLPDSAFARKVELLRSMKCKLFMCNVLFPGELKIAGPDVNAEAVLTYLEGVLKRADAAGVENLILGSGGARRLPGNYDKSKATADFILLAKKMAALAAKYNVRIILENLNSTETNFLNTVRESADVVRRVSHPNFRLNADLYHMLKEDESPESIVNAGKLIVYVELAEEKDRSLPGVNGEDFGPYLQALRKVGFEGPIMIEGRVTDPATDFPRAFRYLSSQISQVYGEH